MSQVTFTDPRTATTYEWPTNPPPDGVTQAAAKQRQIQRASNTANVGATKQQGDDGPFVITWKVAVFYAAHEEALWEWWQLSKKQTIYLTDWNGETSEGQIIGLGRTQKYALSGPGDTQARVGYTEYDFSFEVYRFVSGPLATAGVTP